MIRVLLDVSSPALRAGLRALLSSDDAIQVLNDSLEDDLAFLFGGIVTVLGTGLFMALTRGLATSEPTAAAAIPVALEPGPPGERG